MAVGHREPEVDSVDARRVRKAKKRLANEIVGEPAEVAEEPAEAEEAAPADAFAEAKRLRKAAKKAAKGAAAVDGEAKRLGNAAKKPTKEVARAEAAEDEDEGVPIGMTEPEPATEVAPPVPEIKTEPEAAAEVAPAGESGPVDEAAAEAKRERAEKRARIRAKKAKASGVEMPQPKKAKRDAEDQGDEAPKEKKAKTASEEGSSKEVVHKFGDDFKVFVRGLPWSIDEDALKTHFEKCGDIEDVKMPKTPSGSSRGVGFIKFKTQEGFDAALDLDNTECGGRSMNVEKVAKREGKGQGKEAVSLPKAVSNELTVFIRGLPFAADETHLRKDFEECGAIEKITLPMNPEGKPKGICFIKFLDPAGLEAALKFDNTDYGGRTINVHKAEDGNAGKSKK